MDLPRNKWNPYHNRIARKVIRKAGTSGTKARKCSVSFIFNTEAAGEVQAGSQKTNNTAIKHLFTLVKSFTLVKRTQLQNLNRHPRAVNGPNAGVVQAVQYSVVTGQFVQKCIGSRPVPCIVPIVECTCGGVSDCAPKINEQTHVVWRVTFRVSSV